MIGETSRPESDMPQEPIPQAEAPVATEQVAPEAGAAEKIDYKAEEEKIMQEAQRRSKELADIQKEGGITDEALEKLYKSAQEKQENNSGEANAKQKLDIYETLALKIKPKKEQINREMNEQLDKMQEQRAAELVQRIDAI